jgi:hypothetical protein
LTGISAVGINPALRIARPNKPNQPHLSLIMTAVEANNIKGE